MVPCGGLFALVPACHVAALAQTAVNALTTAVGATPTPNPTATAGTSTSSGLGNCDGILALSPMCRIGDLAKTAANDSLSIVAGWFGKMATDATNWLWGSLGDATSLDLTGAPLQKELWITSLIAALIAVALLLTQVGWSAAVTHNGAGIKRALAGVAVAGVGAPIAFSAVKVLLAGFDEVSAWAVQEAMGTDLAGLHKRMEEATLLRILNPGWVLTFALAIVASSVILWLALEVRAMSVYIAVVLSPLAWSGAIADATRVWLRKWAEFVLAMIVSKLVIVLIFMVGVTTMEAQARPGASIDHTLSSVAGGCIVLTLAAFAPKKCVSFAHFAGAEIAAAHAITANTTAGARTVIAAPQKVAAVGMSVARPVTAVQTMAAQSTKVSNPASKKSTPNAAPNSTSTAKPQLP